jgi:hypothetical protein
VAPPASAGIAVVFAEDFDGGAIGPAWTATDANNASGLDYWGVTNYRAYAGNNSAWSAQVGTQAIGGQNNSAVHEYDDNMQADLIVDLQVNGFSSLTLSFYYWWRGEGGGGDFIQAWYEAGGSQFIIFTNTGTANWDLASVAVPNNVERLIIRVVSDAANHGFEGGYVDDVVLTGTENSAPSSNVNPQGTFTNVSPYDITYVAADGANESGIAYVELWYRLGTTGTFTKYTRPSNPLGQWIGPVRFDVTLAAGEGYYEFYSLAVDGANNAESPPAAPDASTTFDTTAPALTSLAPQPGVWQQSANVTVSWQASDALSGLDRFDVAVDGSPSTPNGLLQSKVLAGLTEGPHSVVVEAYDLAGNVASFTLAFGVDTVAPDVTITAPTPRKVFHTRSVTVRWTGTDATSGIDRYDVWLDSGTPTAIADTRFAFTAVGEGTHVFHIRATDRAGNVREVQITFHVNTNPWSFDGPYGGLPLILLLIVLALLFVVFLLWKRRKDENGKPQESRDDKPSAPAEPEASEGTDEAPPPPEGP